MGDCKGVVCSERCKGHMVVVNSMADVCRGCRELQSLWGFLR